MKNDECIIRIVSNKGFVQTFHKNKNKWIQTTNGIERIVTAEQLLSHILPLLIKINERKFKLEIFKNEKEFKPKMSLAKRYSIENMAKNRGLTIEEFKTQVKEELELRQKMINERLAKGYTQEQAENETLRCLYIPGFGPDF